MLREKDNYMFNLATLNSFLNIQDKKTCVRLTSQPTYYKSYQLFNKMGLIKIEKDKKQYIIDYTQKGLKLKKHLIGCVEKVKNE